MTLLERWDTDPWSTSFNGEIRRAIAIAEAFNELDPDSAPSNAVKAVLWQIRDRADELLAAKGEA